MSKTSSTVKNRYRDKTYETIQVLVKNKQKETIKQYARSTGESLNALINRALAELMEREPIPGLTFVPMGAEPERTEEQTNDSQT